MTSNNIMKLKYVLNFTEIKTVNFIYNTYGISNTLHLPTSHWLYYFDL